MELNIKEYIAPILKWWWLILLTTLVAGVASFLASGNEAKVYRTTTTLLVGTAYKDPNPSNAAINISTTLAKFYADMANRSEIRSSTADALGLNQLPRPIVVRQVNDNFIDISVTDTVPERAQAVANELARQLIRRTPAAEGEDEFVDRLLSDYQAQIEDTTLQIENKQLEIGEATGAREISQLQTELSELESTKNSLISSYSELSSASNQQATNTIQVIEPAYLPRNPVTSNNTVPVLTAAAIGLVLSSAAAFLLEFLDDTVRTSETIKRITGIGTLVGISEIRADNKLITLARPRSPISEAFRVLRTSIRFALGNDITNKILLVSSAVPEEGKSTTTANLAIVMAQTGNRVLLIDADLRRPSQHKVFGLHNDFGLSELLLDVNRETSDEDGQAIIKTKVQNTPVDRLHLMTCGPIPPNPSELLGSRQMERFLEIASAMYDFVLLDSPPVLSVTDATLLSAKSDGMILVARAGKSRKQYVKQTVDRLKEVDANVIGYVLNAVSPRGDSQGAYYYYKDPYYSADVVEASSPLSAIPVLNSEAEATDVEAAPTKKRGKNNNPPLREQTVTEG